MIGYAMQHSGHVIIDPRRRRPGNPQGDSRSSESGLDMCVFAEGHRFNDNRVHEFEDGAAWLAILLKLPAVPMSISGSGPTFPRLAKVVTPGMRDAHDDWKADRDRRNAQR